MIKIPPRTDEPLTEHERHVIRESVKGCWDAECDVEAIVDVFGLKDGELDEIINGGK